jgi:hypothetical protein
MELSFWQLLGLEIGAGFTIAFGLGWWTPGKSRVDKLGLLASFLAVLLPGCVPMYQSTPSKPIGMQRHSSGHCPDTCRMAGKHGHCTRRFQNNQVERMSIFSYQFVSVTVKTSSHQCCKFADSALKIILLVQQINFMNRHGLAKR